MTYPLMDALESAVFRMSLDELSQVEVRRHGRTADLLSRAEILRRIYCPHERYLLLQRGLATRVTVRVATFHELTASEVAGYSSYTEAPRISFEENPHYYNSVETDECHSSSHHSFQQEESKFVHQAEMEVAEEKRKRNPKLADIGKWRQDSLNLEEEEDVGPGTPNSSPQAPKNEDEPKKSPREMMVEKHSKAKKSTEPKTKAMSVKATKRNLKHTTRNAQKSLAQQRIFDEDYDDQPAALTKNPLVSTPSGPAFLWRGIETLLPSDSASAEQLMREAISLHRILAANDKLALAHLASRGPNLADLTLSVRGVTSLALTAYLRSPDMTAELLAHLQRLGQLSRAVNATSVDNVGRRETPLIIACRTGQLEIVSLLLRHVPVLDLESRDCQGKTALWHAVREEHVGAVMALVEAGARVFFRSGDTSCPLQLVCKTGLLKNKGRQLIRYFACHGANLDYTDAAGRNAVYWCVRHGRTEAASFLLAAGAAAQPWEWLREEGASLRQPPSTLSSLARSAMRRRLVQLADGRSIFGVIERLNVGEGAKALMRMDDLRIAAATSATKE